MDRAIGQSFQQLVAEHGRVEAVAQFEEEHAAYTHIGGGNTRAVFRHSTTAYDGSVVVKLAFDGHTAAASKREQRTHDNAPPALKQYLAPVYDAASDGSWLVQQRVKDTEPDNWEVVKRAVEDAGLGTVDVTPDNIGVLDGEPVIYDYPFSL